MNRMPEEILRKIWRNVYSYCVIEIRDFLKFGLYEKQVYIYKKPNALNRKFEHFHCFWYSKFFVFKSVEQNFTGGRTVHFLSFHEAILYLKHHPTGLYNHGGPIEWVSYSSDENDSESDD